MKMTNIKLERVVTEGNRVRGTLTGGSVYVSSFIYSFNCVGDKKMLVILFLSL